MSTQRRDEPATLAMKIRRMVAWLGAKLFGGENRTGKTEVSLPGLPTQSFTQDAERQTAPPEHLVRAATNSLSTVNIDHRGFDHRSNRQAVRSVEVSLRSGSPPTWSAAFAPPLRTSPEDCAIRFPALNSRIHRALPWDPAAEGRRTERYDGQRNLHFQHAA
jgi:hypothetical protein